MPFDVFEASLMMRPARIAGFQLAPYSAWHDFILERLDNDIRADRPPTLSDIYCALWILSHGRRDGLRMVEKIKTSKLSRALWIARLAPYGIAQVAQDLSTHIHAYDGYPDVWMPMRKEDQTTRKTAMPVQWFLVLYVAHHTSRSPDECWDMPINQLATEKAIIDEFNGGPEIASGGAD